MCGGGSVFCGSCSRVSIGSIGGDNDIMTFIPGLHDRTNEGHFSWLDGLEFANGGCAPVSANGGNAQNCVAWTTNKPISCWSDKKCADRYPFMCRMPIEGDYVYMEYFLMKRRHDQFPRTHSI